VVARNSCCKMNVRWG